MGKPIGGIQSIGRTIGHPIGRLTAHWLTHGTAYEMLDIP